MENLWIPRLARALVARVGTIFFLPILKLPQGDFLQGRFKSQGAEFKSEIFLESQAPAQKRILCLLALMKARSRLAGPEAFPVGSIVSGKLFVPPLVSPVHRSCDLFRSYTSKM